MARRGLCLAAFAVFLGFAVSQNRDPDAFPWTLIYGYAAMLSLMAALGVRALLPAFIGAAAYAVTAYRLFAGGGEGAPVKTTEVLGLVVCSAWTLALAILELSKDSDPDKHTASADAR